MPLVRQALILTLGAALAGTAMAEGENPSEQLNQRQLELWKALDKDANGIISDVEAAQRSELFTRFHELDANRNGQIEAAELARFEIEAPREADDAAESQNR